MISFLFLFFVLESKKNLVLLCLTVRDGPEMSMFELYVVVEASTRRGRSCGIVGLTCQILILFRTVF